MTGNYIGEAKAEFKADGNYNPMSNVSDTKTDIMAVLKQEDDLVTLKFGNTALLYNCELKGKINQNKSAYIVKGTICDTSIAGRNESVNIVDGSISVGDFTYADVIINIAGFTGGAANGDHFTLNFKGKSIK